ncbi:30S ribosomal protein S16 [Candidatus Dojkabacteria bacterium]|uniref:Small ribosomal subunit protein bS16 n=1 Tax=Candidatus Dojkabacteria bacterium TaxID=2099670 RepID=A0A955I8T6_9BACT|nr:30S ribosomal protein S16 [Candidatus Dojkabacteria bacterium]
MVKIRLARFGKKKQPTYKVVVTNARTKRNTLALEYLGSYDPFAKKDKFKIDQDRYKYWIDNGAQPTYTVKSLMVINGYLKADIKKPTTKKSEVKKEKTESKKEEEKEAVEVKAGSKKEEKSKSDK